MGRDELVRMLVLNEISDDYESITTINAEVTRVCSHCGLQVTFSEIGQALLELIEAGLAKAYVLSSSAPAKEIKWRPSTGESPDYYFFQTGRGRVAHAENVAHWPIDENGGLVDHVDL